MKKVNRAGYNLSRVLVVDHARHKVARNFGNAICIEPFEGGPADAELPLLPNYLESLMAFEDFRVSD